MSDLNKTGFAFPAEEAELHHQYRAHGWWLGEPLIARYRRLSAGRDHVLAVADSRGNKLTHAQLWSLAQLQARALHAAGIRPGDVVLVAVPNCVHWQSLLLAIFIVDAIPATIPVRTDADNFSHVIGLTNARSFIVADGKGSNNALEDIAVDVIGKCHHAVELLLLSDDGKLRHRRSTQTQQPEKLGVRDLDHITFTSSTTGRPKAVAQTCDTLGALNQTFTERFGLHADAPIFMPSPLGHSVGSYHGGRLSLFNASPLVLQDRWDPELALTMVSEFRCEFTGAATPFLMDLVNATRPEGRDKLDSLRWFLCGGAQVPPTLMDRAQDEFPKTRTTVLWGMTEGGVTTCHSTSPREKVRTTCGVGLPGLELHTIDKDGRRLTPGTEGELVMRGPGVFVGYINQADLYASLLTSEGFFRTGDLAVVDDEGYVKIVGREKDLIIRGGVNISPIPIEDALSSHPNIASIAVVGAPDDRMGELLCAVIQPRGRRVELEELRAYLTANGLPKYLTPERLHFVDDMPRTPAGKIRKVDLRSLLTSCRQ